jgi:hypothetical protein
VGMSSYRMLWNITFKYPLVSSVLSRNQFDKLANKQYEQCIILRTGGLL